MSQRHYLLFIDNEPVNEELKDYFEKFNLDIIQQKKLFPIHVEKGLPTAILINWSLLRTEPEAIEQFYNMYPVPLIVINNKPDEESSVAMLEAGADDFMTKPIYPRELHARIGAISRRVIRRNKK